MAGMSGILDFYRSPGPVTGLGIHATLVADLPADIAGIRDVVQGLLLHVFWAERHGVKLSEERKAEVNLRRVDRQLSRLLELDPSPLAQARPPERRLVGNCRDFSTIMAALLRAKGIPARARCGFGTYFLPDRYEDHWVCECWDAAARRWRLVDAQLDGFQREKLKIDFDPLDVPRTGSWSGVPHGSCAVRAARIRTGSASSTCTVSGSSGATSSGISWR